MKKLLTRLTLPFTRHLSLFVVMLLLFTTNSVYLYASVYRAHAYVFYLALHGLLLSYTATLIVSVLPKVLAQIVAVALLAGASLLFVLEFYCINQVQTAFDGDFATLLMATNPSEAVEFMQSMVPWTFVALVAACFAVMGGAYYLLRHRRMGGKWATACLMLVLLSLLAWLHNPAVWEHALDGKIVKLLSYEVPSDLSQYYVNPKLSRRGNSPRDIVVIMGESLTRRHCSLYGYDKMTNPRLAELVADSSLMVFADVNSAALHTMKSFEYMMSAYTPEDEGGEKQWFEYLLLPDVLRQTPYKSHWISNQANVGVNNNVTRLLADAFDDSHFCGNVMAGDFRTSYDGAIIDLAASLMDGYDRNEFNFYFFHLMGSHFRFDLRYPEAFARFNESDYADKPAHQRATLAAYDNSVLYNDSVVYAIMQLFRDREAIVLYMSDHGMDIFVTSDTYAAHGKPAVPASAKCGAEIPFVVYASRQCQEHYPEVMKALRDKMDKPFRTDSLMFLVMDLMGIVPEKSANK